MNADEAHTTGTLAPACLEHTREDDTHGHAGHFTQDSRPLAYSTPE